MLDGYWNHQISGTTYRFPSWGVQEDQNEAVSELLVQNSLKRAQEGDVRKKTA